jgi:sulfide:quinone oxidoreductase
LANGTTLAYDVLLVASGAVLQPEETEGLLGEAWRDSIFTF